MNCLKSVVLLLVSGSVFLGCATIIKSERTPVRFTGGLEAGETKINLPDGSYNLSNGQSTILVTRARQDIPISVTCNSKTREGVLVTKFDALTVVGGNFIIGGVIGLAIDITGNKAYDPPDQFNLAPLCATVQPEVVAEQPSPAREPVSSQ